MMTIDYQLPPPVNNIICMLTDPDGNSLGAPVDLPQDAGPPQLQALVNVLLKNVTQRLFFLSHSAQMGANWPVVLAIPLFDSGTLTLNLHYIHAQGHKKWITGLAWEPVHLQAPCRRFASSSKDGDVRVWDTVLRKCVMSLTGHTLAVTCVKWGGDGLIYSSSQDCTIKVWETSQGKLIRELKGHGHWVNTLALSTEFALRTGPYDHTGKQYTSAEEMKELWDMRTLKLREDLPGHADEVFTVDWSPDGEKVASGGKDRVLKLWMS